MDKNLLLAQIDEARKVFIREWDGDHIFLSMRLHEHLLAVFVSQLEKLSREEAHEIVSAADIGEYVCEFFNEFIDNDRWDD